MSLHCQSLAGSHCYRLYAFTDASGKTKPGMVALPPGSGGGAAVHLEVWEMPLENFGAFMLQVRL